MATKKSTMRPSWEDETNLIVKVVMPLKADAMKRAAEFAQVRIDEVAKELKAANYDVQACAPYPSGSLGRDSYHEALRKYHLFSALTKWRKGTYSPREPHYADMDSAKKAKFIKNAKEAAAAQYDMFVGKMISKIGDVTKTELEGNHVWGYSFLTVRKPDGSEEIWKTQMILNISKLGLVFNQWPSRKVKHKN